MGHPRSALWLGLIALMAPGLAAQEDAPGPLRLSVVSVERVEKGFRVTLRGEVGDPGNSSPLLKLSPLECRLAADGRSLEMVSTGADAVSCRVEVQRGAFTAVLTLSRPVSHEASLGSRTATVPLFDADGIERRHRKDLELFAERVKEVRAFVATLEPHDGSKELLPDEVKKGFQGLLKGLLTWHGETHLRASGSALMEVLKDFARTMPRKTMSPNAGGPGVAPAQDDPSQERRVNVEAFRKKIAEAQEVAVRESLLLFLAPLEELVSTGRLEEARRAAKALREIRALLEAGDLAEAYRAYGPAREAAGLVSDEKLLSGDAGSARERLKKLRDQICR